MVAVSDFSGLLSSICALASAPAITPIVSLQRCMTGLHIDQVETDGTGFRALGAQAMAERFLGVLGHYFFEFRFRALVFQERRAGAAIDGRKFSPDVGRAHIDDAHRLDPWSRCLDAEQARGLAALDAAPELL